MPGTVAFRQGDGILLDQHIRGARRQLGRDADTCWSEGRQLSFDDAITLALASS